MMNTSVVLGEVHKLAKAYLLAKSGFNRAYCRFWQAEVEPCSEETGWKLLEVFRGQVDKLKHREGGIKQAAWEIFRLELVGAADYAFEDVLGFVKWYGTLTSKIGRAIGHLYEFHGDSFGDLIDSYPLAGRELVQRALASHPKSDCPRREGYLDEREVGNAVVEKLGLAWHKLICEGENYIVSALEAACRKCYLHRILTGLGEQIAWTEDEKSAVDFASQYDD
jgi:hypothetical protein